MSFRIAIGQSNCAKPYSDDIQRFACDLIDTHIAEWRLRLPADLAAFPIEAFDYRVVSGRHATIGLHKETISNGDVLVVFQVFIHTWQSPTFLAIGKVGRIYAEGLVISRDGVHRAPNDLMWEFR